MDGKRIEIDLIDETDFPWGHISDNGTYTSIGMREDGKISRKLFTMDRNQLKQLVTSLQMLIKDTD